MKFRRTLVAFVVLISLLVVGISADSYILKPASVQDSTDTSTDSISGAEQSGTDASPSTETDTDASPSTETDTDASSSTETDTDASSSTETSSGTESESAPTTDETTDSDSDGLLDEREAELGTDPERADSDGDGLEDGSELNEYGTDPTSADSDSDGINDGEEVTEYGTFPLSPDSDGDGLSDLEEKRHGTNATNPDTDGDGLPDGAEINSEALSAADPLRMDVFVEVDYMQSYKPREEAIDLVAEAYEDAPITNPDGTTGISLHIILDESIETESPTDSEQKDAIADEQFDHEGYGYHYGIAVRDARGDDFAGFASDGSFAFQTSVPGGERYSHEATANIFMHELGHSVGLYPDVYEGIDSTDVPFSEYGSVMNYNAPRETVQYNNREPFDDWEYIANNIYTPFTRGPGGSGSVAGVSISNQSVPSNGTQTVSIDSVITSEGGFVAIRAGYAGGDVIGTSEYLVAGGHQNVRVKLDDNIDDETTVVAVAHLDTNNNREYDFNNSVVDTPYTDDSGVVVDTATVSVNADTGTD